MATETVAVELAPRLSWKLSRSHVRGDPHYFITIMEKDAPGGIFISFRRTIRVPDNQDKHNLPPDLGPFQLYSVKAFEDTMPLAMKDKGGLFFPPCIREAMWINFSSIKRRPFTITLFSGGINAVTGEPMMPNAATRLRQMKLAAEDKSLQDYMISPGQHWLDGFATGDGTIRQFVAMPMGEGYSVEAQISGEEVAGGLQFLVTPAKKPVHEPGQIRRGTGPPRKIHVRNLLGQVVSLEVYGNYLVDDVMKLYHNVRGIPPDQQRLIWHGKQLETLRSLDYYGINNDSALHLVLRLRGGGDVRQLNTEMVLGAGGQIEQTVFPDYNDPAIWDHDATAGKPVTAETYRSHGYPFYKFEESKTGIVGKLFEGVKSVKQIDVERDQDGKEEMDRKIEFSVVTLNPAEKNGLFVPVKTLTKQMTKTRAVQF